MSRRFALFGTGDWAPWADGIFAAFGVAGHHAAVIAAGQAENGPSIVDEYRLGAAERLERAGVLGIDVPLLSRHDADNEASLAGLDNAAFVYVLGGGPRGQIAALRGSRFWRRFLDSSLPYVGSSGGAMLLGARCPASPDHVVPGLAIFPDVVIAAHWNELTNERRATFLELAGSDLLVGLDVDAALIGDGTSWEVHGLAEVHVRGRHGWHHYSAGAQFDLPLLPTGRSE